MVGSFDEARREPIRRATGCIVRVGVPHHQMTSKNVHYKFLTYMYDCLNLEIFNFPNLILSLKF